MKINGSWDSVLREERLKMNDYLSTPSPGIARSLTVPGLLASVVSGAGTVSTWRASAVCWAFPANIVSLV
jgi:hypothetical protein